MQTFNTTPWIPGSPFGALSFRKDNEAFGQPTQTIPGFTEFYCQANGSNLNAGSTTGTNLDGTPVYSGTGSWVQATGVFTPTDNSVPANTLTIGMWGSIYITVGATISLWIARITVIAPGVNGAVTVNTNGAGAKPADGTGTITLKVGGAWLGPNAAVGFPFTLTSYGTNQDASTHQVRTNLKNDQTYTMTAAVAVVGAAAGYVVQGYTSTPGDGGKATFDGTTSTGQIFSSISSSGNLAFIDLILKTSIGSGTSDLVTENAASSAWIRCVFTGSRGNGLNFNGLAYECEAYGNNTSNTAAKAGFRFGTDGARLIRCISHDNAGSNSSGVLVAINGLIKDCIFDTNGQYGVNVTAAIGGVCISNSDFYNNGSDGINIASTVAASGFAIENCNFIKNGGAGINNASVKNSGYVYNCGFGSGTQANGLVSGLGTTLRSLIVSNTITYAPDITPWIDPANGDFRISASGIGIGQGRGAFTETASSYSGTVGYPDISAAAYTDQLPALNSTLAGVTRDASGNALGLCVVNLFRTADNFKLSSTTSDASGIFSIAAPSATSCYLVAYLSGSPDVEGTTLNTLAA